MEKTFRQILYGGDYNPNQWDRKVWEEDMRLFPKAGINSVTINVFSWARLQPSENEYSFEELDDVVEMLSSRGYDIVMATSTAALPAWMFHRYPEVGRTDFEGRRHKFGNRHNACPNSLVYQTFARRLAGELARRYGNNRQIVCWHINNEYGGECFCENCEKAFRVWLKNKYKTLDALNQAWNMEFWGHTVYDWDEIVLPNVLGEARDRAGGSTEATSFAGISVDYRRFMSDSMLENFKMERDEIRRYDPDTPVTTNLMGTYKNLDYFKWAKEMDIVSWDNYPAYNTPWSHVAMTHDLMRGLKGRPFMLMEQTPSQQNWQPYNSLKRPGQMRAQSYQTLAHGADTIQFFQLRRSVGGCEKFHGAVIAHAGTENTRVFREVSQLGMELKNLGDQFLGADNASSVGMIFDWDNYWAFEYTSGPNQDLKYVDQLQRYYEYFYRNNIMVDMVPADGEFSKYKILAAPVLYMVKEGMKEALEEYVSQGGILITGFMSGLVDQSDNVYLGGYPGPLRKLAGVWVEEIDALAPEQTNHLRFADGTAAECRMVCDLMHLEGAEALAWYQNNFYAGTPAVTCHSFGKGTVFYVGTVADKQGLAKILDQAVKIAGVSPVIQEKTELEVVCRTGQNKRWYFVMNMTAKDQPLPGCFAGREDILTGKTMERNLVLKPYDVVLVRENMGK